MRRFYTSPVSKFTHGSAHRGSSSHRAPLLQRFQWLPEFYLVSLRIVDPCETAVVVVFAFWIDPDTFGRELREESVKIGNAKVDHEGRRARVEVLRVCRKRRPHRHSCVGPRIVRPAERRALARLVGYAQMACVPLRQSLRISRLEKDSSNTRDTLTFDHSRLRVLIEAGNRHASALQQ